MGDVAAPWLGAVGGDARGTVLTPAIVARVSLRYDEAKADLVHDAEYEAVISRSPRRSMRASHPAVDHDDRDLLAGTPPESPLPSGRGPDRHQVVLRRHRRDLVDHLSRGLALEVPTNTALRLFGRRTRRSKRSPPGALSSRTSTPMRDRQAPRQVRVESDDPQAADRECRGSRRRPRRGGIGEARTRNAVDGRIDPRWTARRARVAGRVAGLGSRQSGVAVGRRVAAGRRRNEWTGGEQGGRARGELEDTEAELAEELTEIDARWMALAKDITTTSVALERTDVKVTELVLAWLPVC